MPEVLGEKSEREGGSRGFMPHGGKGRYIEKTESKNEVSFKSRELRVGLFG